MASRDRRPKPTPQGPKYRKLPPRTDGSDEQEPAQRSVKPRKTLNLPARRSRCRYQNNQVWTLALGEVGCGFNAGKDRLAPGGRCAASDLRTPRSLTFDD